MKTPGTDRRRPRVKPRTLALAVIAGAIVHICATLTWPYLTTGGAFERLSKLLPVDQMRVLPPTAAKTQVMAFQAPDLRYAVCRFNASEAAIVVRASLPESGWTFSVHGTQGQSIYVVSGQDQRATEIALLLLPPGERFVGPLPEARLTSGLAQVPLPTAEGLIVIRAPSKGAAYHAVLEAELAKASCTPRRS